MLAGVSLSVKQLTNTKEYRLTENKNSSKQIFDMSILRKLKV